MNAVREQMFVSEPIKPDTRTADTRSMASGGPGLPAGFTWRGKTLAITSVCKSWRETGPCKHGGGEQYVRKHWYEVETSDGRRAKIYFERAARSRDLKKRWWLFSIENRKDDTQSPVT